MAIEMIAKHEAALRRTARRFSICADDAEDAYQRALEILLVKAPPGEARELVRWMQTVTKHEALAIRRSRERQLGPPIRPGAAHEDSVDWLSLIPFQGAGPAERAERREDIARSREALRTLKPAELRALTLLAEGYSYAEIGGLTGFSRTKVNRCLAEGRERFRAFLARSEAGDRCAELRPALSAFCDGEAGPEETAAVREHLRACGHCRAALRAYRAAPGAVAALAPAPALLAALFGRGRDALDAARNRLPWRGNGTGGDGLAAQAGTGGAAASAGMAKALAICAGTVGGAACVAAGVVPPPPGLTPDSRVTAHVAGVVAPAGTPVDGARPTRRAKAERASAPPSERPKRDRPDSEPVGAAGAGAEELATAEPPPSAELPTEPPPPPESAPVPPPEPPPPPSTGAEASGSPGSAAGEFGP